MGGCGFGVVIGEAGVGVKEENGLVDEGVFPHGDLANAAGVGHGDFSEIVEETDEAVALKLEFHYVELFRSLVGD